MAYQPPRPDLRASDADREATVDRLHTAATEGRLDADELEERLSAAYAAKTCRELERLTADVTPAPPLRAPWSGSPVMWAPARRLNGLAVASLIAGFLWFGWIGSVLAVIFGHVALRQIARSGGRQSGRLPAGIGLVLGYIGLVTLVLALGFGNWTWG
jgi:hypothetical protein